VKVRRSTHRIMERKEVSGQEVSGVARQRVARKPPAAALLCVLCLEVGDGSVWAFLGPKAKWAGCLYRKGKGNRVGLPYYLG
jgi:hypothetical protein